MVAADDAAAKAAGGKRITPAAKKTTSTPVAEGSAQSFDDNRGLLGAEDSGSRSQQPSGTTTGVATATNTVAKKAPPTGQSKAATASAIISSLTNKRMAGAELKSSSATTRLAGSESSVQGGMLAPASMIESTRPRQAAQGSARPAAERAAETSRSAGRQSQQQQRVASVAPTAGNVPRRGQAASVQPQQQQQRGNNNAQAAGATTTRTPIPGVRQLAAAKGTSHAGGAAASLGDSAARNGALASPLAQPLRQLQPSNKMPSTSKALRTLAANSSLLRRVVPSGSAKSAAPVPLAAKRAQATVAKTTANSQREQQQPSLRRTLLNANSPQRAINAKKHSIVSQKLNSQKVIKTSEALASGHSQTRSYRANQSAILPTATSKQPQQQQYRHSSRSSHSSASASKTASSQAKSKNRTINTINTNNNNKTITNTKMADQAVIDKLEAGFAKLQAATPEQCHSLLKKYLTREVLDQLKTRKTAMGATLLDVAQSGFENLDSGVGIYAPDAESYTLFAELFNPIIEDYHGGFKPTDKHPASDFGDLDSLVNVDPTNEYVISTRVRCGRSLQGYPFNPCLTEAQYKEMESKVSSTLKEMQGDLAGTYYPLTGMTKETQQQLIDDHFLFKEGDRFLQAANACRYWPTGRGIYHNEAKSFLVWVNEEDHLRIISMQKGGDLKTIFSRMVRGVRAIEAKVPFSRDDRLGFLTFCPTNLGTTIRASVHIKLPKLAADRKKLEEVASKFNLQVRGTSGEHTESVGGVYDISNKRRLGLTEYQAVREMQDGILELIKIEKSL